MKQIILLVLTLGLFSATQSFAEHSGSGLTTVRPYPTDDDVCQILAGASVGNYVAAGETLIGCPNNERGAISDRKREGAEVVGEAGRWTLLRLGVAPSAKDLASDYLGYTVVFFDRSHGTQVEYFEQQTAYLWYPGNTVILPGNWKILTEQAGQSQICFSYPTSSLNPVTGVRGSDWECSRMIDQQSSITHRFVGDPFNLKSGNVPYIFERRKRISPAKLARGAGIDRSDLVSAGKP